MGQSEYNQNFLEKNHGPPPPTVPPPSDNLTTKIDAPIDLNTTNKSINLKKNIQFELLLFYKNTKFFSRFSKMARTKNTIVSTRQ